MHTQKIKVNNWNCTYTGPDVRLDKDVHAIIINTFQKSQETMFKHVKEDFMRVAYKTENINKYR